MSGLILVRVHCNGNMAAINGYQDGKVYPLDKPLGDLVSKGVVWIEQNCGKTPDIQPPKILGNWAAWLTAWIEFAQSDVAKDLGVGVAKNIFKPLLTGLRKVAGERSDVPPLPAPAHKRIHYPEPPVQVDGYGTLIAAVVRSGSSKWQTKVTDESKVVLNALPKPATLEANQRTGATAVSTPGKPRTLLTGWHAITVALEMKYAERAKVKRLNGSCEGPIKDQGKGTQPKVYKDELIEWWNTMATRQQELSNQSAGKRLSAEEQHNYGREGTAAPEIGGGVKKRRRDRRP